MIDRKALERILASAAPQLGELLSCFEHVKAQADAESDAARERERQSLKKALEGAAALELSTIPPYLCALWSIRNDRHPIAASIREIVQEEMLHLALVTNLLVAIGGKPNLREICLAYPTALPLGAHPGLIVSLGKLDAEQLLAFMHIERPAHGIAVVGGRHPLNKQAIALATSPPNGKTIGELYTQIEASFQSLKPRLSTSRQITGPLAWSVTWSLKGVDWSIELIKRQGEGALDIYDGASTKDLAHFYRFWEALERRRIVPGRKEKTFEFGEKIAFDFDTEVFPMAKVPKKGYSKSKVSPEVWRLLHHFDCTYSKLLDLLQDVWERDGGQASFWQAIAVMFELEKYARPLMQIEIPGQRGATYGPCFRYLAPEEREIHG